MVTQLLFGDIFEVLETKPKWLRIKQSFDDYEGWIDRKMAQAIDKSTFATLNKKNIGDRAEDLLSVVDLEQDGPTTIALGSSLPMLQGNEGQIAKQKYAFSGSSGNNNDTSRNRIVDFAYLYLNAPYLWGGKTPFGIDCSGFTQMVYKLVGMRIARDASQQALKGRTLSFVEEAQAGDLAFFDNKEGNITHVGIVLPQQRIIHASGKVRIDLLDHHGIFNETLNDYTHQLRLLKTYLK